MNFLDERLPERFWSKCTPEPNSGCWLWFGPSVPGGYGQLSFQKNYARKNVYVHRLSYTRLVGPIPKGLQIDHLCRNRACCNPAHLEPVTPRENILRGIGGALLRARHAAITACPMGHLYDDAVRDRHGHRICKPCRTRVGRRARDAKRMANA